MVIAEELGQPDELLVRLKACQRELFMDELELLRSSAKDTIAMVRKREDTNPEYVTFMERQQAAAVALMATIAGTIEPDEDFRVVGDAAVIYTCVHGAAGIACERLMDCADALRPGLDSANATRELTQALDIATLWTRTLLAVNAFAPVRKRPQQIKPASDE